jgi:hypothetical protein
MADVEAPAPAVEPASRPVAAPSTPVGALIAVEPRARTVLALQRTAGNQAVGRLIQRADAPPAEADAAADAALESDVQVIKTELDAVMYPPSTEEKVLAILRRWAVDTGAGGIGKGGRSRPLDKLLLRLRASTTQVGLFGTTVSYYDLMFEHFDRGAELRALRDQHSALFVGEEPLRQPELFGTDKDDFFGSLWEDVKSGAVERRIYAYMQGLIDAGVGLVEGMAMLLDPMQWPKIAEGIGKLPQTVSVLWKNRERFWQDFLAAKPEEQARIVGRVIGEIEIQLAALAAGAGPGKAASAAPEFAEATVAVGRLGSAAAAMSGGAAITIDLGKLGSAGQSLILMSQVAEGATEGKEKADEVKAGDAEPAAKDDGSPPKGEAEPAKGPRAVVEEGPYAGIKDKTQIGPGRKFTATQKNKIIEANRTRNGGVLRSDDPADPYQILTDPVKSVSPGMGGSPQDAAMAAVDHIVSRAGGGTNAYGNARVISQFWNNLLRAKGAK